MTQMMTASSLDEGARRVEMPAPLVTLDFSRARLSSRATPFAGDWHCPDEMHHRRLFVRDVILLS